MRRAARPGEEAIVWSNTSLVTAFPTWQKELSQSAWLRTNPNNLPKSLGSCLDINERKDTATTIFSYHISRALWIQAFNPYLMQHSATTFQNHHSHGRGRDIKGEDFPMSSPAVLFYLLKEILIILLIIPPIVGLCYLFAIRSGAF